MSRTKSLILLLDSLEKREFDKIVKIYLQKEYNFEKIVFTDGKSDTGIDIKVFDFEGKKIQYQLTTQKSASVAEQFSFKKKLIEDLEKAKINTKDFGYNDKLIFFYSKTLTNDKIRTYEKMAFKEFGINLQIIEANRIAEESENIIEIQQELYKINELDKFKVNNSEFDNKLFYDLLSFGKPTEFKTQVIESFVLQLFYTEESLSKEDIIKACEDKFSVKENLIFYERLLNKFQTEWKIVKDKPKNVYTLTDKEKGDLKIKNEQFNLDRDLFFKEIKEILKNYEQVGEIEDYIKELKQLYVENFDSDLAGIISDEKHFHISNIFKPFRKFIEFKVKDDAKSKLLAIELLNYCLNNKFIQKMAATKVYSNKIDNQRLQNYINSRKRVFIDTPVALYSLCVYYKYHGGYSNFFYKATKNLIDYSKKEGISLNISERYILEVKNHIRDAFRLIPFTNIPNFLALGSSRNIFYNYYNFLVKSEVLDDKKSFSNFLSDFGFTESSSSNSIISIIEHSLSQVNILKHAISKDYNIEETNELFESSMTFLFKSKSNFARNCDSIMLEFLADKDIDVHPIEPIFLTWDKTFFEVQTRYMKRFPNSQNWLLLTPNKIVDIYALVKFSINSETITENLLALISDDIITNTHSLVDTLSFILNPNDEISLEYTSRLARIRETEINQINNAELTPPDNYEGEAVIDDVFFNLTNRYKDKPGELTKFKTVFTKKELMDDVINLLLKAIKGFYDSKEFKETFYEDFDKLVLLASKKKE